MANMKLTIQHDNVLYEPPVEEGIKIEWERTGSPGKLTFTIVNSNDSIVFAEGDPVCFYYDNKPIFMGYVFTKKTNRDRNIEVTCYDQMRYLKNKFTYVFEKKTATQIINALCKDFNLAVGNMDDTKYVIPAVAEENKSALDIVLTVLEETLLNTGEQFVLYDDFGKLRVSNVANMKSTSLICEDTAEDFDYKSSIDDETYNQIILYYKQNDQITQMYTTNSPSTIKQWGTLRYFEEVKNPSIGQNKANSLLKLYNRKTREFKITGAFGDITVRGGTLIPVVMELGDISVKNFMLVEKVTHKFDNGNHTMDLTLDGAWENPAYDGISKTVGELLPETNSSGSGGTGGGYGGSTKKTKQIPVNIDVCGSKQAHGSVTIHYCSDGDKKSLTWEYNGVYSVLCDEGTTCTVRVNNIKYGENINYKYEVEAKVLSGGFKNTYSSAAKKISILEDKFAGINADNVTQYNFTTTVRQTGHIFVKWTGKYTATRR